MLPWRSAQTTVHGAQCGPVIVSGPRQPWADGGVRTGGSGGSAPSQEIVPVDIVSSIGLGVGLAVACGFRVFLPVLIMGLAARAGFLEFTEGLDWMAATPPC